VVRLGLLALFLIGIMTIFGESLAAVLFPAREPSGTATSATGR
jgi:hypothetical protein